MRHLLGVTLIASALTLSACGGTPADIRARIKTFQDHANAGRLDEILREYTPGQSDFDKYMQRRRELGRMIHSSEAKTETVTWNGVTLVTVHHNTEFERGHAVEMFQVRIDGSGTRITTFNYNAGKKMWCPMLSLLASSQCSIEDAPKPTPAASRSS